MKKIVFLCEHHFHYLQGGAEYQVLLLAKNLILQGFEVHHIFIDYGYDNIPTKDESGYLHPLRHWNSNNWYTQYTFSKKLIINIINSIKPDWIYHRNLSYFLNVATEYSLRSQCKTIWHISADKEIRPIKVKFNRKLFRSYFMRKYFIKKGTRIWLLTKIFLLKYKIINGIPYFKKKLALLVDKINAS